MSRLPARPPRPRIGQTATYGRSWWFVALLILSLTACNQPPDSDTSQDDPPQVAERVIEEKPEAAEPERRARSAPASGASQPSTPRAQADIRAPNEPVDRENYAPIEDNPVKRTAESPVSTFSVDVDTGAYANVRRLLDEGRLPPEDAVRIEEMINYFDYAYAPPADRDPPFTLHTELGPSPWNPETQLLSLGLQGYEVPAAERPAANLVFLIDVSGSMQSPNKLPLLRRALELLSQQLDAEDSVAIAVYAGASGQVLAPTPGDQRGAIANALQGLRAGGSTNGGAGIELAYALAEQARIPGGINRVILATDGDFNVGTTDFEALIDRIERKRASGIALTTLGFGTGNYNDRLMEQLADAGNGNYAYIDRFAEARKALVEELGSTLMTIAKDVKIQVEFNPAVVAEYRRIGYVNRTLRREDFNNDRVDAGEIGAGHTVTALYELVPAGTDAGWLDPLRYGEGEPAVPDPASDPLAQELAFLRLRYKAPDGETSQLIEQPIPAASAQADLASTSDDFRFAAAVAALGQILRGGRYTGGFSAEAAATLAQAAKGDDPRGYRGEFIGLARTAAALMPEKASGRDGDSAAVTPSP